MTLAGARLGARFSLATNRLRYCGPEGAADAFLRTIVERADGEATGRALLAFEALAPYLTAIGAKHGLHPLDEAVVEAYWIGNDLLDAFTRADFIPILERLGARGLPPVVVRRLALRLPDHPIPHHAFHVAFVGVGSVTGRVATNLENMDRCRPSWAQVEAIRGGRLDVSRSKLELSGGRPRIARSGPEALSWDPRLLPSLRVGDSIAVHWGLPVLRLAPDQLDRLETYTRQSLELAFA